MNTKTILLALTTSLIIISCSNNEENNTTETDVLAEEVTNTIEEVVEEPVELSLEEKIIGKWQQTHKRCDENGENGEEMTKETIWELDGKNVTWSSFTHPYRVENGQILIGEGAGSPYEIVKEEGDVVILKAIKTNRFMRLVKVVSE